MSWYARLENSFKMISRVLIPERLAPQASGAKLKAARATFVGPQERAPFGALTSMNSMTPNHPNQLNRVLSRWEPLLSSPLWYLTIIPELQALTQSQADEPADIQDAFKAVLYDFFERHLVEGDIFIGRELPDADRGRMPIDMVVIHHTGNPPGLRSTRLSAIELIRLYGPYFAGSKSKNATGLRGRPIASGHVRNGNQVFWPYHWIVRGDGRAEQLLYDSEIGWHAGNWDINCRSVGVVLDGDYQQNPPSNVELQGIAALIKSHYAHVPLARVVGHREVNPKTVCPSDLFLDNTHGRGWKENLLELMCEGKTAWRPAA
jgi:hypothetical protein